MEETYRCTARSLTPAVDTLTGWTNAIMSLAQDGRRTVRIDCEKDRIPAGLLAAFVHALPNLRGKGCQAQLENVSPEGLHAVHAFKLDELAAIDASRFADGTFAETAGALTYADNGLLVIEIDKDAGQNHRLISSPNQNWLQGISCRMVALDLRQLDHINSVLVALFLRINQAAKPAITELRNVNRQVDIQLNQLRINHLLKIRPSK
jgi:anti-anti-sigma regulatory factor